MATNVLQSNRRSQIPRSSSRRRVVIIGGGQAGLAMGHYLAQPGQDFLILDAEQRTGDVWRGRNRPVSDSAGPDDFIRFVRYDRAIAQQRIPHSFAVAEMKANVRSRLGRRASQREFLIGKSIRDAQRVDGVRVVGRAHRAKGKRLPARLSLDRHPGLR